MRALVHLVPALLLGASPAPSEMVPLGAFRTWGINPASPLSFSSGGLAVRVAGTLCRSPAQNEGCTTERSSNQATITISRPGTPPFQMISNREASFVRVAVIRFGRSRGRTGVVIDNQWGGSAGITAVTVVEPVTGGFRAVPLKYDGATELVGNVRVLPLSLPKDEQPGFVLEAHGFNYSGECNACTRGVPLVLAVRDGRSADVSAAAAVRPLFARDLPARRRICVSTIRERNGNCAAFVADAARLGQIASAWRLMLSHYRHEPASYPAALKSFLVKDGYVTPAEAVRLPLA